MRGGQACPEDDERADGDSMWKTITEVNFDEMLASILPELAAQVDPRRETEFLDKEMKDLKALMGGAWQAPDLLARVPLKGGRDIWLALHVEVQDKGGENFPERMFYHHSIIRFKYLKRKKYEEELVDAAGDGGRKTAKVRKGVVDVVSLALLTAKRPGKEAGHYEHASFGNELRFVYPTVKLWELDADRLEKSPNPFDLALLAAKRMIDSGRSDNKRIAFLKQLGGLLELYFATNTPRFLCHEIPNFLRKSSPRRLAPSLVNESCGSLLTEPLLEPNDLPATQLEPFARLPHRDLPGRYLFDHEQPPRFLRLHKHVAPIHHDGHYPRPVQE